MKLNQTVDVKVGDFSKTPFGRYIEDGKFSGQAFRENVLKKYFLDENISKVIVHLDTVVDGYEYASSFLEESFGGLVREYHIPADTVLRKLEINTKFNDYKIEITYYIEKAGKDA